MTEKLKLFFLKANEYESSLLTNTNCIREHQQKTFVTLRKGKLYKLQQQILLLKKAALKTYTKFTGKLLCIGVSLHFTKFLRTLILKNICERLLLHLKYYNPPPNIAKQ